MTPPLAPVQPGTARQQAIRSWRITAWIAAGFLVLVGVGMVVAHIQHKASDPWRSPVLLEAKEELRGHPTDEALKQQIRQLDLRLRERYFGFLSLKATGIYLMFAGAAVLLLASGQARKLNQTPPLPQPAGDRDARLLRQAQLCRIAVTVVALATTAGFASLAVLRQPKLPGTPDELSALLHPEGAEGETAQEDAAAMLAAMRTNWPSFRGYQGSGVAGDPEILSADAPPVVTWQTESPAPGYNSPLVWGDKLMFTGGNETKREIFCLSAASGELLWRREIHHAALTEDKLPEIPEMTGWAASTAATDGKNVYAIFASGELGAVTLEGELVWTKFLGVPDNPYGHASSLATWQNLLIVQFDQGEEDSRLSKIMALDGTTGEIVWNRLRPVGASWASPIVIDVADQPQIVTVSLPWVIAYDAGEGRELWRAKLMEGEVTPSPVYAGELLCMVDPGDYYLLGVRPDGTGDVTQTHVAWRAEGEIPDITSPVSNGELVFTAASSGLISCFDAKTGELVWEHDTEAEVQASPCIVGTSLVITTLEGALIALQAGRESKEQWRLELEDRFYASPAFANGRMYLRGDTKVWCLGKMAAVAVSSDG